MGKTRLFEDKAKVLKPFVRLRLFVHSRKQGSRIESVPLKRLVEMSKCGFRNWRFEDGWLVLEAV
jgi:hypothetical protein